VFRRLLILTFLLSPVAAAGQSLELYGSAGPTVSDDGHSFTAGAGFSPHSRLSLVFSYDQTYLSTQTDFFPGGYATFRGGRLYLGTAELRVMPFRRDRFGPYGVAGLAGGVSRPNVNDLFPNYASNSVLAMMVGGGVHAPVGEHLAIFGDYRMIVGAEGNDGMVGVAPLRLGAAWRF
jgi:Outer membrane protein beta-barrel domain